MDYCSLLVAGCTTEEVPTTPEEIPVCAVTTPVLLSDPALVGSWKLTMMELPGRLGTLTIFHRSITIIFSDLGTLEGNGGCNTYKGLYTLTGKGGFGYQIRIEQITSGNMFCPDSGELERTYLQILSNITSYGWLDNGTTLYMQDGFEGGTLSYSRT
jgi:heat shock protein HslJ